MNRSLDGILPPTIIMLGCQPWPPQPDPARPGVCPVCRGSIQSEHHRVYCGWDDNAHRSINARCKSARIGLRGKDRQERAERATREDVQRRNGGVRLTESERRRLWNGYRGSIMRARNLSDREALEATNRTAIARKWLTETGQEPDWDLILDKRGNTIGRFSVPSSA